MSFIQLRGAVQNPYLIVESIENIPPLESEGQPHGVCDLVPSTATDGLFAHGADVDKNPSDHSRTQFVECLDVEGANCGVELPSKPELLPKSNSVAARGQLP